MTGTSLDGIDAVLVRVTGRGLSMEAELVRHTHRPFGPLGPMLRSIAEQTPTTADTIAHVSLELGRLHADIVRSLIGSDAPDLICIHGQTVAHAPPISWQMINPGPIAGEFACPIVSDLRSVDLALGGQGAPITPIADHVLFADADERRAVINLGGFCNATLLNGDNVEHIRGFDVCACNHVLDGLSRMLLDRPYDENGAAACKGEPISALVDDLHARLCAQSGENRSLGTGHELTDWGGTVSGNPADILRTGCVAIARTIAERVLGVRAVDRVIVAGGGAHNTALLSEIRGAFGCPVETSDAHRVPIEAREAIGMAVLGALCLDRVPITLPSVTGVRAAPIAGCVHNHHLIREGRS